jgi:hypothetical protein
MPTEPAMSGEITPDGVLDILREIEARRVTGRLRFTATAEDGSTQTGEVELIAGQVALDQEALPDGSDPVERLLALRGGIYVVHQRLPVLPVSHGDERQRTGSLAVHVPADLMNYCEQGGLTGTLTLERDPERVELVYESGELLAIRVDGREDGDLSHAFGWEEGTFRLEVNAKARSLVPDLEEEEEVEDEPGAREPTTQFVRPRGDDTGRHFLKVLEVALTTIVDQRERARPSTRTSPIRSATKSVRPRPATMPAPPPKRRREPTVRVVYLKPDDPTTAVVASDMRTRHVAGRGGGDAPKREEALPDARPERRAETAPRSAKPDTTPIRDTPRASPRPSTAHSRVPEPQRGVAPLVWVIAVIAIGLFVIGLLTQLPAPR